MQPTPSAKFTCKLAVYNTFIRWKRVLDPGTLDQLLHRNCPLPRFVVQLADKAIHSRDTGNSLALSSYISLLNHGFLTYGDELDLTLDDDVLFDRYLGQDPVCLRELVVKFHYFPTRDHLVPELLCKIIKLDVEIFHLLVENGLDFKPYNDRVWAKVFKQDHSIDLLEKFQRAGFELTANVVKTALCSTYPQILTWLRMQVSGSELFRKSSELLHELLGPDKAFSPSIATFLTRNFNLSNVIDSVIHTRKPFPRTRPYLKTNPYPAWRWILRTFGPTSNYTASCFTDMLSRAVADPELHSLLEIFVDAGVHFQVSHVKIIACRLLHRGMSSNALRMMQACREQVLGRSVDQREWQLALQREVLENVSWNQRVASIQIEGGVGGGVFGIHEIPRDGIVFIDQVGQFVKELGQATGRVVEHRASLPFGPPKVTFGIWKRVKRKFCQIFKKNRDKE